MVHKGPIMPVCNSVSWIRLKHQQLVLWAKGIIVNLASGDSKFICAIWSQHSQWCLAFPRCWLSDIPMETFNLKRLHLLVIYFLKKMKKSLFSTNDSSPVSSCESFKSSNRNVLKAITSFILQVLYPTHSTGHSKCHLIAYFGDRVYFVTGMQASHVK